MKEAFEYILQNYLPESRNEFRNNSIAEFLRKNARENIKERAVIDTTKYKVEGSPGKGNWATVP